MWISSRKSKKYVFLKCAHTCDSKLDGADESYSSLVSLADPRLSRTFRVVAAGAGATLEVTGEGTPSIELGLQIETGGHISLTLT